MEEAKTPENPAPANKKQNTTQSTQKRTRKRKRSAVSDNASHI
jgi:hypothetical protein